MAIGYDPPYLWSICYVRYHNAVRLNRIVFLSGPGGALNMPPEHEIFDLVCRGLNLSSPTPSLRPAFLGQAIPDKWYRLS